MHIFLKVVPTDAILELEANLSDTVETLKASFFNVTGIATAAQTLVYGGMQLDDSWTLRDSSVLEGATIYVVVRGLHFKNPAQMPFHPTASASQRNEATLQAPQLDITQSASSSGPSSSLLHSSSKGSVTLDTSVPKSSLLNDEGWDDDEYILEPETYSRKIEALADTVVKSSEFFSCRGVFALNDIQFDHSKGFASPSCDPRVWEQLYDLHLMLPLSDTYQRLTTVQVVLVSLAKTYLILCQVRDSLDLMTRKNFCKSSYNILIRHNKGDVARLVKIEAEQIESLQDVVKDTIFSMSQGNHLMPEEDKMWMDGVLDILCSPFKRFMHQLHLLPLGISLVPNRVLSLCRLTAILLDLGLVGYVGSHGSRFDLDYLKQDIPELTVDSINCGFGFKYSLRRLTCLDGFLDQNRVWVFHLWERPKTDADPLPDDRNPLSVLAYIEDIADVWGPIWSVPADPSFPGRIQQYNVSKGFIRRSQGVPGDLIDQAVPCHWYNWSSTLYPTTVAKDALISKYDRLLIGGPLRSVLRGNHSCNYTLDDYEKRYGLGMVPLGTKPSRWNLDTRSCGLNISQYMGISVMGTQKKLPKTSLKQHIWDKWNNNPQRANPGMLNQFLGVEISHCTGNARRIRIRDLFFTKPIQACLAQKSPGWTETDYGKALLQALLKNEDKDVEILWREQCKQRTKIGTLVCDILSVLDKTGIAMGQLMAAFLNDDRESVMPLQLRYNQWASFLEDSHITAIYAIINENCLSCHNRGHYTSICNFGIAPVSSYTVLETQLAVHSFGPKLHLDSGGYLKRISSVDDSILMFTVEDDPLQRLTGRFARLGSPDRIDATRCLEVRDEAQLGARKFYTCLRATTASFGGLHKPRIYRMNELPARSAISAAIPARPTVPGTDIISYVISRSLKDLAIRRARSR